MQQHDQAAGKVPRLLHGTGRAILLSVGLADSLPVPTLRQTAHDRTDLSAGAHGRDEYMTTTTTATQAIRPLATRSRAELERAVIEAARWFHKNRSSAIRFVRLDEAIADLDEWEKLRAEAAELAEAVV